MKIAVYTIALNEAANVEAWAESAKDADWLLIADTGSTDDTPAIARKLGLRVIEISVVPWRFDNARNAALAALPKWIDMCITLDMDERLDAGWREALEAMPPNATRARTNYIWSWNKDGTPGHRYMRDHVHARSGYRWRRPVHEEPTRYGPDPEVMVDLPNFHCHHEPDYTKTTRKAYLPLMKMAVAEEPTDSQLRFWYARELFYYKHTQESILEFNNHIAMPTSTWPPEIAGSMYFLSMLEPTKQLEWLEKAEQTAPQRREHKYRLAEYYYHRQDWEQCLRWADAALAITWVPVDYMNIQLVWGPTLYEFRYMALFNLGRHAEAAEAAEQALALAPNDARITANLATMRAVAQNA